MERRGAFPRRRGPRGSDLAAALRPPTGGDVIAADTVDPAIHGIRRELAALEQELADLRVEASRIETEVERARRAAATDERAVQLLDGVLTSVVLSARRALDDSYEEVTSGAATHLAAGRAAADHLAADVVALTRAGHRRLPRPDPPTELRTTAVPLVATAPLTPRPPGGVDAERDGLWRPSYQGAVAPGGERRVRSAVDATALAGRPEAPVPSGPAAAESFQRFWHEDRRAVAPESRRDTKRAVVDALLPVVLAAVLVILLLSWLG